MNYQHTEKWFINRIGKRIYRKPTSCSCESCMKVAEKGVVIIDWQHAVYMHTCHNEEGIKYFDNPVS